MERTSQSLRRMQAKLYTMYCQRSCAGAVAGFPVGNRRVSVLQLKLAYSRHKDLNVKGNNDRSCDFTVGQPGAPGAPAAGFPSAARSAGAVPAAGYTGQGADLLIGGGGTPLGMHETPPTGGPLAAPSLTRASRGGLPVCCSPDPCLPRGLQKRLRHEQCPFLLKFFSVHVVVPFLWVK